MSVTWNRVLATAVTAVLLAPATAVTAHAAPPSNDAVPGATVITALPTTLTQDTTEATTDPVDHTLPGACQAPPAINGSVWFAHTASDDDGFAVTGAGSDFTTGFFVTAGEPSAATVVTCGAGSVEVATQPGTTYYVMAFSDTSEVVGGNLRVTFLEVPPEPRISVTVHRRARLLRDGTVRVRGTYTCTDAQTAGVSGTVQQDRDGRLASDTFFAVPATPTCDGTPQVWRARGTVDPDTVPLRRGRATVNLFARACNLLDCTFSEDAVTVRLTRSGRR